MHFLFSEVPVIELSIGYWIALIAIAFFLWKLKVYHDQNNYWRQFGIDGPWGLPFVGIVGRQLFSNGVDVEVKWLKRYGKIYGTMAAFGNPLLLVAEPHLIKQILVKDFHIFTNRQSFKSMPKHKTLGSNMFQAEDDAWRRIRAICNPSFTRCKLKKLVPAINSCVGYCVDNLETHIKERKELDLREVFGCFTMDVIAKSGFRTDTDANKDPNNPVVFNARKLVNFTLIDILILLTPKSVLKWLNIQAMSAPECADFFVDLSRAIIKKRKVNKFRQDDMIQLLIDSQIENNDKNDDKMVDNLIENDDEIKAREKATKIQLKEKKLTENEMIAQAFLFFVAGYETTKVTLSLMAYELAVNQDIQERLCREIKSAPKDENGQIDYDTLTKLPYLDAVVSETLRKYPAGVNLERRADYNYQLDGTDIILKPGNFVQIPVYAIHHCEEFHPDPEKFNPERFLPENRHLIQPYTYLPFGGGPRHCIGFWFAKLVIKLLMSQLVLKYRFVPSENTEVPLKHYYRMIFIGIKKLKVAVERR